MLLCGGMYKACLLSKTEADFFSLTENVILFRISVIEQ
jgi:hypothetical protein